MLTQIRSSKLYRRAREHEVLGQFVRYAMVGVLNVTIYFLLFNIFLHIGLHPIAANAAAFFLTNFVSFFLQKRFAFRDDRRTSMVKQYLVFLFMTLIGLAIQTSAFTLFHIPLRHHGTLGSNLAALCALPFSVVWNFTAYRLWTFKPAGATA